MKPILDLDKLRKRESKRRRRRLVIGAITLSLIAGFGVIKFAAQSDSHKTALLTGNDTASIAPISPTAKNSSLNETPLSPNSVSTNNNSLKQQIAQEEALAKQEDAIARQDIANAQIGQSALNSTPPPTSTSLGYSNNTLTPATTPSSAPDALSSSSGVLTGTYYYAVSYVISDGTETALGPVSLSVSPNNQQVWITNIPTSTNNSVTERKIYRTTANGSMSGPFYLVTTLYDNTTTNYYDNIPDNTISFGTPKYE